MDYIVLRRNGDEFHVVPSGFTGDGTQLYRGEYSDCIAMAERRATQSARKRSGGGKRSRTVIREGDTFYVRLAAG